MRTLLFMGITGLLWMISTSSSPQSTRPATVSQTPTRWYDALYAWVSKLQKEKHTWEPKK